MTPTLSEQFFSATALDLEPLAGWVLLDGNFGRAPRQIGGIHLPDASSDKKKLPLGRILKVGKGLESDFAVGDVIAYRPGGEYELEAGGIVYRFLNAREVDNRIICKARLPK